MANHQNLSDPETMRLRKEAGQIIKQLREKSGHSQGTLAKAVGAKVKTFVSQVELGLCRIPPVQVPIWAQELGYSQRDFMLLIMPYYDPIAFSILFEEGHGGGGQSAEAPASSDETRRKDAARITELEREVAQLKRTLDEIRRALTADH